ncbi:DUF3139 domain-containing protein [Paenibacillus macerans]|uniref:DUF3139 domain-containing protein n=1 Tax=Paenibacillus macerans TaxID=44252 RepID=UPI00203AEDA9|nr:DUF3139 domain-containing protein [Paenibacillus macerans]MCM3697825.1 DUF3139 domain-containing protein [Paenibacillus macerans]
MNYIKYIIYFTIILIVLSIIVFTQYSTRNLESEVFNHLLNEGYQKEEILSVKSELGKAPVFSATVIFKDEPNARYFYKKENGAIIQYSRAPVKGIDFDYQYKHQDDIK